MKFIFYSFGDTTSNIHIKKDVYGFPRGFVKAGYDSVLVSGKIINPPYNGIRYSETHNIAEGPLSIFRDFFPFFKILKSENPDVVLFFHNNILLPLTVFIYNLFKKTRYNKRDRKQKVVWILKNDYAGKRMPNERRTGYIISHIGHLISSVFVDYVIVENICASSVFSRFVFPNDKLKVIPVSYSEEFLKPIKYTETNREKKILCVGRITKEFGLTVLIQAFSELYKDFKDWKIVISGPINDKNYYNELRKIISDHDLDECVIFSGYIDNNELERLYRTSAIFCRPSLTYGNEVARIEAAVNGLPVVTSDTGCPDYFASLGMRLFRTGSVSELSKVLEQLMRDEELRVKISNEQFDKIRPFEALVYEFAKEIKFK